MLRHAFDVWDCILEHEWPAVRARLEARLRRPLDPDYYQVGGKPAVIESDALQGGANMRILYRLSRDTYRSGRTETESSFFAGRAERDNPVFKNATG